MSQTKKERLTEEEAKVELDKGIERAEKIIDDANKLAKLIDSIDFKKLGEEFSKLRVLVDMAKSYVKKEYTKIPLKSILTIVGAIIYFVNPFDVVPDFIPGIGHIDDLSVILLCWKMVQSDINDYLEWKKENEGAVATE